LEPREERTCNNIDAKATTQQLQLGEIGAQEFNDIREDMNARRHKGFESGFVVM
jgi:hypothetical protein